MLTHPLNPMPPIPIYSPGMDHPHPGSFGIPRHLHVHTGVDLYAPMGAPVMAMEAGKVIKVAHFTGSHINMPWWRNTMAVYIEGETGVFNYGEIMPLVSVGCQVSSGQLIGYVIPVLRKFKGRPMSMLHLELYDHGYVDDWGEWKIGDPKPEHLQDPTKLLCCMKGDAIESAYLMAYEDPYWKTAQEWSDKFSGDNLDPGKLISEIERL